MIKRITQFFVGFFKRQPDNVNRFIGAMQRFDPVRIIDGVDYSLPILLPNSLRDALQRENKLVNYITESFKQAVQFQFDNPYKNDMPFAPVSENPLEEWDYSTRCRVLENTHAAYNRNPDAKRGVRYMAQFAIGDGFNLTTFNPDVERVLDAFIDNPDNRIREYERQAACDLLVDGELILRYFTQDGETVAVPMRPWELEAIETELGFYRRPVTYLFQLYQTQGDDPAGMTNTERLRVPAGEVQFVAINNHAYELRGRPELYPILPWLKARKDWLENRARINYWSSVILWRVSVNTNNPASLAAVASRWATPPQPGSIAVEHADVGVEPMNAKVGAGEAADDGRQLRLQIATGFGLPEYFFSDGSNTNLATATRQQLPALTTFGDLQRTLREELWKPMFKRVIMNAVDAGILPPVVQKYNGAGEPIQEFVATVDAFDIQYADLMESDSLTLTQALTIQRQNGWVDDSTAIQELGRNPDDIQHKLRMNEEEEMRNMAQGRMPRRPDMRPDALPDDVEDEEDAVESRAY